LRTRGWALALLLTTAGFVAPTAPRVAGASDAGPGQGLATGPGDIGASGQSDPRVGASVTVPGLGEDLTQGLMPLRGAGPQLAGSVDPRTYIVGPGDVMQLQLWGKVSRSILIEVGPEGVILLPGAGNIRADGLTLEHVRSEVLRRMGAEFRGVNMDLRLVKPRQFLVYLAGQVRNPGQLAVLGGSRVADVLMPGLLLDNASRRKIEVLHRDGSREMADLDLFLRTGKTNANPFLQDGDVIHLPVATDFIYADGAVARPGRYELGPSDSLLTLFQLAGDPIPAADAERALFIRWRQPYQAESLWVGLDDVYSRTTNPPLREGDRLYVYYIPQYHLQHEASIVGEVARPGVYPIQEGRHRLSDLVSAAGGFLPSADLSAIRLKRISPGAGEKDPELERLLRLSRNELTASEFEVLRAKLASQRTEYRVDWSRLMAAKTELDVLVRDGDEVRVERLVSSVRVDGEVRRPGIVAFVRGLTIEDYVRQAGGYTDRAWKGKVRVSRAVTGQAIQAKNVKTIDPGDLVWVPERPDRTAWEQTSALLTALAQVATIVIAVRGVR